MTEPLDIDPHTQRRLDDIKERLTHEELIRFKYGLRFGELAARETMRMYAVAIKHLGGLDDD